MMNRIKTERWSVILNIGLNNNPLAGVPMPEAAALVRNLVVHHQHQTGYTIDKNQIALFDKGLSDEPTLIVSFDMFVTKGATGAKYGIDLLLRHLCGALNQKAIAYEMRDITEGGAVSPLRGLVGPGAHSWGDFDPSRFINFVGKSAYPLRFDNITTATEVRALRAA